MEPLHQQIAPRAPLAFLLSGLLSGLLLSSAAEPIPPAFLLFVALPLCVISIYTAHHNKRAKWLITYYLSTTIATMAYGVIKLPSSPEALNRPAREATIEMEIERIMHNGHSFGSISGIATVLSASTHSRLNDREKIHFSGISTSKENSQLIQKGQKLRVTGILSPISQTGDEVTDFETYLKEIRIHHQLERIHSSTILEDPSLFDQFCQRTNIRFQEVLKLGSPKTMELANVYVAMLLGRKTLLSAEQKTRYQFSGTMHFFAISGLHIGVIAAVIASCLLILRVPRQIAPLLGLPLLFLYVYITGATPSAIRAFLMATFFWASFAVDRQRSPYHALIGSAILVLLISPAQLWSIGFQLSYTVVLSILLYGLPLHTELAQNLRPFKWIPSEELNVFQRVFSWFNKHFLLLFSVSISAWLASSLLSAGLFGFFAPGAIILNLALLYLVAIVITTGMLSLALSLATLTTLSAFINHGAWLTLFIMDSCIQLALKLPLTVIHCPHFPAWISYLGIFIYFVSIGSARLIFQTNRKVQLLIPPATIFLFLMLGVLWS